MPHKRVMLFAYNSTVSAHSQLWASHCGAHRLKLGWPGVWECGAGLPAGAFDGGAAAVVMVELEDSFAAPGRATEERNRLLPVTVLLKVGELQAGGLFGRSGFPSFVRSRRILVEIEEAWHGPKW